MLCYIYANCFGKDFKVISRTDGWRSQPALALCFAEGKVPEFTKLYNEIFIISMFSIVCRTSI